MNKKMKEIQIMHEEVDAGFSRNARDRSDYLNHYERIQSLAETQIGEFKEDLTEFRERFEQLSRCVLSIVNEEEAA